LANHPDLEGVNFDLLVVDEYQDLNACDLEVIRLLADRGCSIIAAGDDDQSIYSFRKACARLSSAAWRKISYRDLMAICTKSGDCYT
jgi:superfamily I DNA/RNA helicase